MHPLSFNHLSVIVFMTSQDMIRRFVIAYIDDNLISSPDYDTHIQQVSQVLQCLLENNLFVKGEKCEFHLVNGSSSSEIVASHFYSDLYSSWILVTKEAFEGNYLSTKSAFPSPIKLHFLERQDFVTTLLL